MAASGATFLDLPSRQPPEGLQVLVDGHTGRPGRGVEEAVHCQRRLRSRPRTAPLVFEANQCQGPLVLPRPGTKINERQTMPVPEALLQIGELVRTRHWHPPRSIVFCSLVSGHDSCHQVQARQTTRLRHQCRVR